MAKGAGGGRDPGRAGHDASSREGCTGGAGERRGCAGSGRGGLRAPRTSLPLSNRELGRAASGPGTTPRQGDRPPRPHSPAATSRAGAAAAATAPTSGTGKDATSAPCHVTRGSNTSGGGGGGGEGKRSFAAAGRPAWASWPRLDSRVTWYVPAVRFVRLCGLLPPPGSCKSSAARGVGAAAAPGRFPLLLLRGQRRAARSHRPVGAAATATAREMRRGSGGLRGPARTGRAARLPTSRGAGSSIPGPSHPSQSHVLWHFLVFLF